MFGEYIPSNAGTVDTLTLSDGRKIEVSAVDGDTPYIVAGTNAFNSKLAQTVRSNPAMYIPPQQRDFIEYARGMDGQSAGPQYSTGSGSSRGVSKTSSRTSGSRRGQSLISQEQGGKQSNQIRVRRSAQTSRSRRRQGDRRFGGGDTARQPVLIEYARGMDGQSAGPQYSTGSSSSSGVSKTSTQTSGSRRGQSLISQGQSGKQSNQIRVRRSAQTSNSRRRRADSRFGGGDTARQPVLIEYARGMDGQSAGPQYSTGTSSSGGVSKPSSRTSGSRRGQSLISQGQSGKQSNQIRARVDLQTIRNNQNIARQMVTSIMVLSQKSVNAFLALRALQNRELNSYLQSAQGETNLTRNLISAVNANMNNPEAVANFIQVVGPERISRLQLAFNTRKNEILNILNSRSNPMGEYEYAQGHRCYYRDQDGNCMDHLYAQGQQQARQERQARQEQARQERQRQQAQRDRVARGRQVRDSRSSKGQSRKSRRSQPNRFSRSSGSRMPKRYLNRPSHMDYGYGGGYGRDMSRMSIQERRRMMNRDFY